MLVWLTPIRLVLSAVKHGGRTGSRGSRMPAESLCIRSYWLERLRKKQKRARGSGRMRRGRDRNRPLDLGFLLFVEFLRIAETKNLAAGVPRQNAVRTFGLE